MEIQHIAVRPVPTGERVMRIGGRALRGLFAVVGLSILLVGLPWALIHFVGWPLPGHVLSGDEIRALLLNPMSPRLLLDVLACLCWTVWFVFVLDVVRCALQVADGIAWPEVRSAGPLKGIAAALVGTIVVTLLTVRTQATSSTTSSRLSGDLTLTAAGAPLHPGPVVAEQHDGGVVDPTAPAPPGMVQVTEVVRAPLNGVHDSLWRVSERVFQDGNRWPELYQLNQGVMQRDGGVLEVPHLVQPGWRIRAYVPAPASPSPPQVPPSITPSDPSVTEVPNTASPSSESDGPSEQTADRTPGVDLGNGVFVSLALVGTVTAALASVRLWRRRRYRVGSGDRADLHEPVAPVVQALRRVHERDDLQITAAGTSESAVRGSGTRHGRDVALDLARTRGLGLTGPGAAAAARAVLVHLIARQPHHGAAVRILVPAADLGRLLPDLDGDNLPSTVAAVESLDAALHEMETALLTRTRHLIEKRELPPETGALVLLASPMSHAESRLQAVLETGSPLGLAGVLLGHWRAGATVRVRSDGTVSATSAGPGDALTGTRLFTLPPTDATELLALLREAEGSAAQAPTTDAPQSADDPSRGSDIPGLNLPEADPAEPLAGQRPPLNLRVFGTVELTLHDDGGACGLRGALTPKQREVLVFLALHPQGARREALNEAVWPDSRPPRPFNSMHNALSLLRRAVSQATDGTIGDLIVNDGGRYQLNPALVSTDYEQLRRTLNASHDTDEALPALRQAVDIYRADLAEDLTALWIEPFRESIRRDILDAIAAMVRIHGDSEPESVLVLLERARQIDRYNEVVYCDIMRAQARLGQFAAIPRTLNLLATALREIDQDLDSDIVSLAASLGHSGYRNFNIGR
ncbi:BTAD domain-containing putative transcriptional regulator [Saccharothrix saharensis]|uniref:BTAD domain-containing putative transcriptional regulator n=1 Tax=Saccharothrix saharensis TaxID=571190 RepID=UPI0036796978